MKRLLTEPLFNRPVAGGLWLSFFLAGCGDGKHPTDGDELLASFELVAVSPCTQGEAFSLTVTAVGNQGSKPLNSFNGTVSLASSGGTVSPASVTLANGRVSAQVTFNGSGQQTLTASAQGISVSMSMEVLPEEFLASLELSTVGTPMKGFGFTLQVTAVGDQGSKPFSRFDGLVSLTSSKGSIDPETVTLTDGEGSTTVTLDQDGEIMLTASAQEISGSLTVDVAPGFVLNGEVAFYSKQGGLGDIWKLSPANPDPVRLTNNNDQQSAVPIWSPDGSRIAYDSNRSGDKEIYALNADGTGEVNLTNNPGHDRGPTWSHDGAKIAFQSDRDGDWEIFVMNADGSGVIQLTNNADVDASPAWSPDGTKIAWDHEGSGANGVYLMNPDGTEKALLTSAGWGPVWSPDGSKIHMGSEGDLFVINSDGSGLIQITNSSRGDAVGSWSPDGGKIAFGSLQTGEGGIDWEVFLVNVDGSGLTQLTDGSELSRGPSWSPDGVWIGFWQPQGIWAVHSASGIVLNLAHPNAGTGYPSWR